MTFKVLREAREELFHAALEYENQEAGLGFRFRREVAAVIERILSDPYLWRERPGRYRRVNLPVFPYYIPYFIRGDTILIAAIAHAKRKPDYWKKRPRHRP
jgi:plasmid stabilization system protein ParE